jgi:hypothetical protein
MDTWQTYDDTVKGTLLGLLDEYVQNTHHLVYLNEMYNTNHYIHSNLTKEQKDLVALNDKARSNVYKAKQRYMGTVYGMYANRFWSSMIRASLFLGTLALLVYVVTREGILSQTTAIWLFGLVGVLALGWMALLVKDMQYRRKDDWNKYYFGTMQLRKSGSCPTARASSS